MPGAPPFAVSCEGWDRSRSQFHGQFDTLVGDFWGEPAVALLRYLNETVPLHGPDGARQVGLFPTRCFGKLGQGLRRGSADFFTICVCRSVRVTCTPTLAPRRWGTQVAHFRRPNWSTAAHDTCTPTLAAQKMELREPGAPVFEQPIY